MKIAVVIPACEYPALLPQALDSVLQQSRQADDIIVVVDGKSIEEYIDVLRPFEKMCSPVIFAKNVGVSAARNAGISKAIKEGNDAVYLLDEDDTLTSYAIERMERAAEWMPECEIFYSDRCTTGTHVSYEQTPEFDMQLLYKKPYIISSVLMRAQAWEAVKAMNGQGFDEVLHEKGLRWEDYLFFLEAYHCGVKFCHVGGMAMTLVRLHNNLGSNIANATIEEWKLYANEKMRTLYGEE